MSPNLSPPQTVRSPDPAGSSAAAGLPQRNYRILLVEDDRGDALLVEESLDDHLPNAEVTWLSDVPTTSDLRTSRPDCILLDLGLPGASGLEALEKTLALVENTPVIVLTGLDDRPTGMAAVSRGASDYLIKGAHDGDELSRAIGYAVERAGASAARSQLREAELLRAENVRLERGLLPRPILSDPALVVRRRYRPGAEASVLGGDFFDLVERPDGSVRMVVGDVSGHGPDEAALGVCLRIAWRTLVLRGTPDDEVLPTLDAVLWAERQDRQFCTVCDITVSADRKVLSTRLAGHPPPILLGAAPQFLANDHRGLPLGVRNNGYWETGSTPVELPWGVLSFTDGVFEAQLEDGSRLELSGLLDLVASEPFPGDGPSLERLLDVVGAPHGQSGHSDDLANLALLVPAP